MGHQHHFLSRLDRIAAPQVELALNLYRDHELLRFILGRVRLPEAAPRVALSLDHPERGPFLIVTREGRFVTCLGEGMQADNLPIITRGQLDGIAAKHGDLKARLALCQELVGPEGGTSQLLRLVYDRGDELSREEFIGITAMQPLLESELFKLQSQATIDLAEARAHVLGILRRTDKPSPAYRELLEAYWSTFWAVNHLTVLTAMSGREVFDRVHEDAIRGLKMFFTRGTFAHRIIGPAAKGVWAVGKVGKVFLPNYKLGYTEADNLMSMIETSLALAVLGLRHGKLRAEARKAIAARPLKFGRNPSDAPAHEIGQTLVQFCDFAFDAPDEMTLEQRKVGAVRVLRLTSKLPARSGYRFERAEDVPQDLALTAAVNSDIDFLRNIGSAGILYYFLPWLARVPPESLYLPKSFLAAVHRPWSPGLTLELFRGLSQHAKKSMLERPKAQTRNGPCACGSGKKFKRCCGA